MIRKIKESLISKRELPDIYTALDNIETVVRDTYDWEDSRWTVTELNNLIEVIEDSLISIKEIIKRQ